jgi:AcrR family transcriptional regulator
MDARSYRSQESLRSAVLTLAARSPIADVTASAICREAGVTRDTFYRHTTSPVDLLADALGAEIAVIMAAISEHPAIGDAERALLSHVQARAAVYRGAMNPILAAPVRRNLDLSIRVGLDIWRGLRPHIVPAALTGDDRALLMATAYAAAGTVGAIEEWLLSGVDDIDRAAEIILAASPDWWLR